LVSFVVAAESRGLRLDVFLARSMTETSRAEIQRWIEAGRVTVNGAAARAKDRVKEGDRVEVDPAPPRTTTVAPDASVRFDVLYTDDDVVVIVKPAGLVVHPGAGHTEGTLVGGLLALGLFEAEEGNVRPGIVHRLDAGTSGVMVVARNAKTRESLRAQFSAHTIERAYRAIVVGDPKEGRVETLHGRHPTKRIRFSSLVKKGKRAVTHVRVIERMQGSAYVECRLETGRTHQIRVHLAETLKAPVLGDPLYGKPPKNAELRAIATTLGHQALHARVLGFVHPTQNRPMHFESEPPEDFLRALEAARGISA
jgi:23S rRNA pseudouridine1911/1915/1917 synthase